MGDVRCYLAHVKESYGSFADVEFSNGYIDPWAFVYIGDGRPIKPGDKVYVCVVEYKNLQFCEVRPVREFGKAPSWKSKEKEKT